MSHTFFVTPYDPIHWKDENSPGVTSDLIVKGMDLAQKAKVKWDTFESYSPFSWSIDYGEKSEVHGAFTGDGRQILILSQTWSCAPLSQFIVWYRQYIPDTYPLFLFVEGSWDSLELTAETTEAEICMFLGLG